MSVVEEHVLTCPKCGGSQNQEIWHSVNVSLDSDMKEKVLNGEFNVFVCRHCGVVLQIEWPMLYHDMSGKLMIWLLPSGQSLERITSQEDEALRALGISQGGYRKRFVHSRLWLAETIRVFDDGLDDRVVALIKAVYAVHDGIPADGILYCEMQDHPVQGRVLAFSSRDSQPFGYPIEYYRRAQALVSQFAPPDRGSWIAVDHEYARKILSACGINSE
jgi:hypothetical protein